MVRKRMLAALAALLAGAVTASGAAAQDCGSSCSTCGLGGYEGRSHTVGGPYNMSCYSLVPYCVACPEVEMATEHNSTTANVASAVRSATNETIAMVAEQYRTRLLVVPERNLVVIKGTSCDPNALGSVLRVEAATITALTATGIRSLREHIEAATP